MWAQLGNSGIYIRQTKFHQIKNPLIISSAWISRLNPGTNSKSLFQCNGNKVGTTLNYHKVWAKFIPQMFTEEQKNHWNLSGPAKPWQSWRQHSLGLNHHWWQDMASFLQTEIKTKIYRVVAYCVWLQFFRPQCYITDCINDRQISLYYLYFMRNGICSIVSLRKWEGKDEKIDVNNMLWLISPQNLGVVRHFDPSILAVILTVFDCFWFYIKN